MREKKLDEGLTTAHLQIALADTILINKVDTLEKESYDHRIKAIVDKVKGINSSTPIHTTSFGDIDLAKILDLHAFEANTEKLTESINYMNSSTYHDDRIATVTITFPFSKTANSIRWSLFFNMCSGKTQLTTILSKFIEPREFW